MKINFYFWDIIVYYWFVILWFILKYDWVDCCLCDLRDGCWSNDVSSFDDYW